MEEAAWLQLCSKFARLQWIRSEFRKNSRALGACVVPEGHEEVWGMFATKI